jgi:hypothetical protein
VVVPVLHYESKMTWKQTRTNQQAPTTPTFAMIILEIRQDKDEVEQERGLLNNGEDRVSVDAIMGGLVHCSTRSSSLFSTSYS